MPLSTEALETNVIDVRGTKVPNIGRIITGSTVGMEALGSP